MSPRIDDRWLWFGFGVFFLLAAKGVRYAIEDTIRLTKLERYDDETNDAQRERPEDRISLEHLKLLTESPNFNIANAATGLVVDRFMRDGDAYRSFMRDLHSEDEATRHRARLTRDFLRTWPAKSGHILPRYPPSRSDSGRSLSDGGDLTDEESRLHDGEANLLYDGEINVVIPSDDDPVAGWTNVPRERPTADEAERRRRRREAMVLRESEGGVEESDIIRPHLSG